ncbi:hypothetical protein QR680_014319 [Steinernema hermaphroditum]|uniref:TILa domain-containing protein n=1 Tax=Steinernema hermaphroditum TaxID=289476 RepID=A0AA39I9W5_9BILA|nr:hypothetical protein QR680_014319 [Steinernema hermaphroditum]
MKFFIPFASFFVALTVAQSCPDGSGRLHPEGESFLSDDCTSVNVCFNGQIYSQDYKCVPNSSCGIEDGFRACVCNAGFKKAGDVNSECVAA